MTRATFVVLTNPTSEETEAEYNDWYDNVHLKDIVAIEGFVSAQRFRVVNPKPADGGPAPAHRYLALYEVDSDDLAAVSDRMSAATGTEAMQISPALDGASAVAFFAEPIGEPAVSS